jgi:hypothetical protein
LDVAAAVVSVATPSRTTRHHQLSLHINSTLSLSLFFLMSVCVCVCVFYVLFLLQLLLSCFVACCFFHFRRRRWMQASNQMDGHAKNKFMLRRSSQGPKAPAAEGRRPP